mmetsp:Transcript_5175/g.11670  ORF Transcript_5175/g.11670 Transcript_5175/m.11670 type:complete len:175 (-) Transcript_5175:7-531(-)
MASESPEIPDPITATLSILPISSFAPARIPLGAAALIGRPFLGLTPLGKTNALADAETDTKSVAAKGCMFCAGRAAAASHVEVVRVVREALVGVAPQCLSISDSLSCPASSGTVYIPCLLLTTVAPSRLPNRRKRLAVFPGWHTRAIASADSYSTAQSQQQPNQSNAWYERRGR